MHQTARQIELESAATLASRIPAIQIPALILWGELDRVIPLNYGRRFAHEMPNARLVILPETGHVPQKERPSEVAGAIADFLDSLE